MKDPARSLREALLAFRRAPGFALAVVLMLAVGLGLTDAILTVVDSVLLQPIGFHEADRIVALESHLADRATPGNWIGGEDYTDLAREVHGLEVTAFYSEFGQTGLQLRDHAEYVHVTGVSPGFAGVLGVEPVAGRLMRGSDATGAGALVSAGFAQQHFGSVTSALGQVVRTGPLSRTITGVLPPGFGFPNGTEVWVELGAQPENGSRSSGNQAAVGRRRASTTPAQLNAELQVFSQHLAASFPEDRGKRLEAVPLKDELVGSVRPMLRLLLGAAAVVLLIVFLNVGHLQLARGTRRLRAATVRTALGASRVRLAADALLESVLLALCGALAAGLLAVPALKAMLRLAPPDLPRLAEIRPNWKVFIFSVLLSAVLMAFTAMLPVLRAWRSDPASALRNDSTRGMEGRGTRRLRSGLLVAEVAFTLMLSVAALVFAQRLLQDAHADLGFAADSLLILDAHLTGLPAMPDEPHNATPEQTTAYLQRAAVVGQGWEARLHAVLAQLRAQPGVTAAAAMEGAPMGFGAVDVRYAVAGRSVPDAASGSHLPVGYVHAVTPEIFTTMGMPMMQGRALVPQDRLGAPSVVVISAALAREQFPGQNPVGQRLRCGYDWDASWWTVVGVVSDIRADTPGSAPKATLYIPLAQHPQKASDLQLMVSTAGDPAALAPALVRSLRRDFPEMAVEVSTMRAGVVASQRMDRLRTVVFTSFGVVSLLLAAAGIYGVTAYLVAQQRFEFGLRFALGATRGKVLGSVLRRSLGEAAGGVVVGLLLAVLVPRALASVLGPLPPPAPAQYAVACLGMLLLVVLAAAGPAAEAARVQPAETLREQ